MLLCVPFGFPNVESAWLQTFASSGGGETALQEGQGVSAKTEAFCMRKGKLWRPPMAMVKMV